MYAVELAFQIGAKKVVVYHTYEVATSLSSIDNTNENIVGELSRQESATKLQEFTKMLQEKVLGSVEIEGYHSYAELPDAVMNLKETTGAQLIVMGITGGNAVKEVFVGSNSVKLARKSPIPVLIVPTESNFNRIREAVLVSDFKDVATTTPVDEIKNMLKATGAHFRIAHVTSNAIEADASPEKAALAEMFKEFHPTFHYETNSNFSEAIDGFVVNHKIDLVVVVPKKHGIFDNMFGVNHTKTLAFRSHVPLLAVQNTEA